jgi:hypothetical protein
MRNGLCFILMLGWLSVVEVSAQITFFVTSPVNLKGQYAFGRSSATGWGHNLDTLVVQGTLIVGRDSSASDSLACNTPLANAAACAGKIVVLYSGSCDLGIKALRAQLAGAIGVVFVNDVGGIPTALRAGPNSSQVTIPTLMISRDAGSLLRQQIDSGNVSVILGNKRGLFANDLVITNKEVVRAPNWAIPLESVPATASRAQVDLPLGVSILNYGTNARTSITVSARITNGGRVIYTRDTLIASLAVNDSMFIPLISPDPLFGYRYGWHDLTYTVTGNGTEDFPDDNSVTTNFMITSSTWSKSRLDTPNLVPLYTSSYSNPVGGFIEFGATFKTSRGAVLRADLITAAFTIDSTDSLNNEFMLTSLYEWDDFNNDALMNSSELICVAEGFYIYPRNEPNVFKTMYFEDVITNRIGFILQNETTYVFSVRYSGSKKVHILCDEQIDYNTTVPYSRQPATILRFVPVSSAFNDGFGRNVIPAIRVDFNTFLSIPNVKRNDLEVVIYPNPANDRILVRVSGDDFLGEMNYDVIDITGRIVKSGKRTAEGNFESFTVEVGDLQHGTYSLIMKTKKGYNATRFVVVH